MGKIDMHVHSKFSKHPSEWFLQRIGTAESYTDPLFIYNTLIERKMDFVTITDHNQIEGALYLKKLYPEKIIVGVESTAYFPEDGCKVHILMYNITESQFYDINLLRENIYDLREYIKKNNIAYSVAHATFSVDGKLKTEHIEKLILLFDVFETINGSRSKKQNEYWSKILTLLKKEELEKLYEKHRIEPISNDPWIKGFTGGSDDHAGLFLGRTYTETDALTIEEFVNKLKEKKTTAGGRHNDFLGFAFSIYKIAYEFSKTKNKIKIGSLFDMLNSIIFEKKKVSILEKVKIKIYRSRKKDELKEALIRLMENLNRLRLTENNLDSNLDFIYKDIIDISDELIGNVINSLKNGINEADLSKILKGLSLGLPASFLIIPLLSSCKHLFSSLDLVVKLNENLGREKFIISKKILWFTDTINDLNGVSTTLKTIGKISYELKKDLKIVVSLLPEETDDSLPPNIINIKSISNFPLPFYEKIKIKIPSILSLLKIVYEYQPDEIYISTPGPVGLLGLLCTILLNVKSIGIYHTDFYMESKHIINDERFENIIEAYVKWFYNNLSSVKVPTKEYINILKERGYIRPLEIFERGIDLDKFISFPNKIKSNRRKRYNLFYVGRISKDKGLDFLIEIHNQLHKEFKNFNLVIVGDGPFLNEMKERTKHFENIIYTGEIKNSKIPSLLKHADLFLFPSTTDTFGMAVLEALCCGVPCIVSDKGGPKEIIEKTEGGIIAQAYNKEDWIKKIKDFLDMKKEKKEKIEELIEIARSNVIKYYSWNAALQKIF